MKFSLIIGTLNRSRELEICLDSLNNQEYKNFEIIVIDQSDDNKTLELLQKDKYKLLKTIYRKVNIKGLSKARNIGLSLASGEYFCLIDDDASYDKHYLENAVSIFSNSKSTILSGIIKDLDGKYPVKEYCSQRGGTYLNLRKIKRMVPSPALIFPIELYRKGICFDEQFGVGSKFGACEETDYIFEALGQGYKVFYTDNLIVTHPTMMHSFELENNSEIKKTENYACGYGALYSKDRLIRNSNRLFPQIVELFLKDIIKMSGIMGNFKKIKAKAELRGFLRGYYGYKKSEE